MWAPTALCSYPIREFESFLIQNPVTLLIRIQKRSNLFKMMQIHKIFVPNIFLYQIKWIFLDLFAKNMNGWSDNSEILCVEQWGRAGKKTRKQQFYPGSRSWCKYFPNSFTTIFIWKKLWNICSFALGFFNEPFNSSLNITLLALFLNFNWGCLWLLQLWCNLFMRKMQGGFLTFGRPPLWSKWLPIFTFW